MKPGKFRECKQCFKVVTAKHFRQHLLSNDHQVKKCVLAMGRIILAKCATCKNTNITQIRAQCPKCCQTLAKMYDVILKPLEISNSKRWASSSAPQKLKELFKLDAKSLSRAYKVLASSPPKLSSLTTKASLNNKQLSSLSYGDLLLEKSQKCSDATALYKSSITSSTNHKRFPKPSNEQSLKKLRTSLTSGSKTSSMAEKTPKVNQKSSQRIREDCSYNTGSHKSSASKQSTRYPDTSSFHQQQFSQSSREYCRDALKMSESKICSMPDKNDLWDEHSCPQSSDNKAFKRVHKRAPSIDSMPVPVTNYHSVQQTTSECTTISVQVVNKNPNVSEYIFKFTKSFDNPQNNAPSSSVVQPDNKINESVTQSDPSTNPRKNLHDSRDFCRLQRELIDLFPDIYSGELKRPSSPMSTKTLLRTLSGNESVDTTGYEYDDWFLATDLEFTDCYNPIEHVTTQDGAIDKPQIKCRDLSSLLP